MIASGYLGASQLEGAKELFLDIVKKKGTVTIIHGMGMWEGIQEKLEKMAAFAETDDPGHLDCSGWNGQPAERG